MAKKLGIYKCEQCGNIVEVFVSGKGPLVCCGEEMTYMEEKKADHSVEKHVPFIVETKDGYQVKVGENAAHPMADEHYIQWVELILGDTILRQELKPGDAPEANFVCKHADGVIAREYCNVHGHWASA